MRAVARTERRSVVPAPAEIDAATLGRCGRGDAMAFRAFIVRYERLVFALLPRVLGRGPHVEDLAQETFLRAYRALPAFDVDGVARPSTWLLTIATRVALDHRKHARVEAGVLAQMPVTEPPASPERRASRAELARAIDHAAGELGEDQRAALVLAEMHGLGMRDIAEALGVPENTAKTRLFRAREHMRARLSALRLEDE